MWEVAQKSHRGFQISDPRWHEIPCITITKSYVGFNKLFMDKYDLKDKDYVNFLFNSKNPDTMAVMICSSDTERLNGYKVSSNPNNSSCHVSVKNRITERKLKRFIGKCYKVHEEGRILYIQKD